MTTLHLAYAGPAPALLEGLKPQGRIVDPALLVSFPYFSQFAKYRDRYSFRSWMLDSGAFSAFNSGKPIDIDAYIDFCKERMEDKQPPTIIAALDVIGDWRATMRNTEKMLKAGVPAMPTYHVGEPLEFLLAVASEFDMIGLGGMTELRGRRKIEWAKAVFDHVWPKKMHGFGVAEERVLMALPFYTADASSWEIGPTRFGQWKRYGNLSIRPSNGVHALGREVDFYMALENKVKAKWRRELAQLNAHKEENV